MKDVRPALLLGLLVLAASACVQVGPRESRPDLPVGFGAVMPDAPFAGYLYLDQDRRPFVLENTLYSSDGRAVPVRAEVQAISVWLGPVELGEAPAIAARLVFWKEPDARTAREDLRRALPEEGLWIEQDGGTLYLVLGEGPTAEVFQRALAERRFVELSAARPRAWNTILSLPVHPPKPVIGAGFIDVPAELLPLSFEALASQGGPDLRQVLGLVQQARIGHVAFAIYGDSLPVLTPQTSLSDLAPSHLGAIAVADTAVPASLLSVVFNLAARQLNLERVRLRDGRAYYYGDQELVTLTRIYGGTIYTSAAFSEQDARELLERLRP